MALVTFAILSKYIISPLLFIYLIIVQTYVFSTSKLHTPCLYLQFCFRPPLKSNVVEWSVESHHVYLSIDKIFFSIFEYWFLSIDFEYWLHLKYYYSELLMLVISLSIWYYSFFLNVWKTWNPKKVRRFLWWKPLPHNIILLSHPFFSSTVSEFFKKCFNSKQKIYER